MASKGDDEVRVKAVVKVLYLGTAVASQYSLPAVVHALFACQGPHHTTASAPAHMRTSIRACMYAGAS